MAQKTNEPGITVRLCGGLGNQLFQYAAGRNLAIAHSCPLYLDVSWYTDPGFQNGDTIRTYDLGHYPIEAICLDNAVARKQSDVLPGAPRLRRLQALIRYQLLSLPLGAMVVESGSHYNQSIQQVRPPAFLSGFWQSEKYFASIRLKLIQELTPSYPIEGKSLELVKRMQACDAISLHVRRGDYVSNAITNQMHGTCSLQYYASALDLLLPKCSRPEVFVFSDDPEWAKKNIKTSVPTCYISHNSSEKSYDDLRLMTFCLHNIIANSSFSWWGAWLGQQEGKVVCRPEKWFANAPWTSEDLLPNKWIIP